MPTRNEEINDIRKEITLLGEAFSVRLYKLEQRLIALESEHSNAQPLHNKPLPQAISPLANFSPTSQAQDRQTQQPNELRFKTADNSDTEMTHGEPRSKAKLSAVLQETLFASLGPISHFLNPVTKWYQHYQNKGQGPIFLFMLVGIALVVGGFAYLTQLLVGELGAGSKSLLLFMVSISVTLGGDFLAKNKMYHALGSAIVSLGLLLNFVTIYLAGSYYHLLSDGVVLLAYFAVGLSGFILSYRHAAQIINALAITGGGIIPLLSQLDMLGTAYYLLGLTFLAVGSLFQGMSKNWYWLNVLTALVITACLEYLLLFSISSQIVGLFSQVFYLLYIVVIGHFIYQKIPLTQQHLMFFTLTLFGTIGLLVQSQLTPAWLISVIALINMLIWLTLLFTAKPTTAQNKSLCAIFASVWLLVVIFTGLAEDFWGLAVGLEGLFILHLL